MKTTRKKNRKKEEKQEFHTAHRHMHTRRPLTPATAGISEHISHTRNRLSYKCPDGPVLSPFCLFFVKPVLAPFACPPISLKLSPHPNLHCLDRLLSPPRAPLPGFLIDSMFSSFPLPAKSVSTPQKSSGSQRPAFPNDDTNAVFVSAMDR